MHVQVFRDRNGGHLFVSFYCCLFFCLKRILFTCRLVQDAPSFGYNYVDLLPDFWSRQTGELKGNVEEEDCFWATGERQEYYPLLMPDNVLLNTATCLRAKGEVSTGLMVIGDIESANRKLSLLYQIALGGGGTLSGTWTQR